MKIDSILLRNIRTFVDSGEILLGDGTISIYGENGAGKSTIVDCIGRAIFGFDPQGIKSAVIDHKGTKYKQGVVEYLLRKGETEGLIEVKFSSNGKAFRVVNTLSRSAPQTWELYIDERNSKLFGKEEIHQRIIDELGISSVYNDSASSLFSNVVCVQQGKIIDEFEYSAQARKDHFDRVLGLYRYRQSFDDSKHVKNNFKEQAIKHDSDVRVLKSSVEHLEKQIESLEEHEDQSIIIKNELKDIEKEIISIAAHKRILDELSETIINLERELRDAATQIGALKMNQSNVKRDLADSRRAKEIVEANYQYFRRYNKISTELQTVREYLRQIAKLQEDHFAKQGEYDRLENRKHNKIADLDNFRNFKKRAEGLKKHADDYNKLQAELETLQSNQRKYETLLDKLDEKHKTLNEYDAKINALELELRSYDALKTEADQLKPHADEFNSIWYNLQRFDEPAAIKEISDVEKTQYQLTQALESIDNETSKLSEAGGNEENETRLAQELQEVKPAYDLYLASKSSAEKLENLETSYDQLCSRLQDLEAQRAEFDSKVLETKAVYDKQEHQRIIEELEGKQRVFNEKKGVLTQLLKQIDQEKSIKSDVKEKKEDLMVAEVELTEIESDAKFFDEVRASFKKLSSLRPVYTREISKHAERYWSSLVGAGSQLFWQEDYLIFKTINDNVISLYEMSGGEKISACLSVRLALQEVIGGLGLFILDEPTVHLDEERRNNLASQIGAITGLSQVIVISHDDAFHSHTRQQITIQRGSNGGGSSVEW